MDIEIIVSDIELLKRKLENSYLLIDELIKRIEILESK